MYLSSIQFKRTENSEWEKGFYVGAYENSEKSVILDSNFKPVTPDKDGCSVWDYTKDVSTGIVFQCNS